MIAGRPGCSTPKLHLCRSRSLYQRAARVFDGGGTDDSDALGLPVEVSLDNQSCEDVDSS